MRTVHRKIVGAFIFSREGKVLLGHNKKGGTYEDMLVIPGGGIEGGETERAAAQREILEETGIDITNATMTQLEFVATGESQKTLKDTNEVVRMKMEFYDFVVKLDKNAHDVTLAFDDDFGDAQWYTPAELQTLMMSPNVRSVLQKLRFLP